MTPCEEIIQRILPKLESLPSISEFKDRENPTKPIAREDSWMTVDVGSNPAASTICKLNGIIALCCGKILDSEFVPILYEC